jgi:serine/threonine protein kinase
MSLHTNLSLSQNEKSRMFYFYSAEGKIIGNYSIEKVIGEGTFGKVYKGFHIKTGEKVVILYNQGSD